jgi:hypothetical protein
MKTTALLLEVRRQLALVLITARALIAFSLIQSL